MCPSASLTMVRCSSEQASSLRVKDGASSNWSHVLRSVSSVNESRMNESRMRMLYQMPNLGCCTFSGVPSKPTLLHCQQLMQSALLWVNWQKKSSLWCKFFTHLAFLFRLWSQLMLTTWELFLWQRMSPLQQSKDTSHWCKTQVPSWL